MNAEGMGLFPLWLVLFNLLEVRDREEGVLYECGLKIFGEM